MAQFKCPECKTKISTEADSCPKCGRKVNDVDRQIATAMTSKPWYKKWWGIALIIFLGIGVIGAVMDKDTNTSSGSSSSTNTAAAPTPVIPGQAEFEAGLNFIQEDNSNAAFVEFQKSMEKGNIDGKAAVGMSLLFGEGTAKDIKKGVAFIQETADQGSVWGLIQLADFYMDGDFGFQKNPQTAISLVNKVIEKQHYVGYVSMAGYYEKGAGVPKDPTKAIEYYRQAGKLGWPKEAVERNVTRVHNTPNYTITPAELYKAYNANEVAADQKYKGKKIRITGTIDEISKSVGNSIFVSLKVPGEYFATVSCMMQKSAEDQAATLRKGQKITIQGTGSGMLLGFPGLKDCWFPE